MFGCTRREVYKARVHAAVYGTGVRPRAEEKRKRQRLSVNTVNFLTPCTVDQAYVYHHSPSARFRRPAASDLPSDPYVWLPAGRSALAAYVAGETARIRRILRDDVFDRR